MTKYTTIQGDTFDSIALKVYGDEKYMTTLINANKKYINVIVFAANVTLKVPSIENVSIMDTFSKPIWRK